MMMPCGISSSLGVVYFFVMEMKIRLLLMLFLLSASNSCKRSASYSRQYLIENFIRNEECFAQFVSLYQKQIPSVIIQKFQVQIELNDCKDDIHIILIPHIIGERKYVLENVRRNHLKYQKKLAALNLKTKDIESLVSCLNSAGCHTVRNVNYYKSSVEMIPIQNGNVSHSYLYHNDEISADMVSVIGKPISQSRLGRHFTLSNESML